MFKTFIISHKKPSENLHYLNLIQSLVKNHPHTIIESFLTIQAILNVNLSTMFLKPTTEKSVDSLTTPLS